MSSERHTRPGLACPPFLRWAGSKRRLVPTLQRFWRADHLRYIEPFAGSACLFFSIKPRRAILGDLNTELVKTYLEIKYRLDEVLRELDKLGAGEKQKYLKLRSADPKTLDRSARAARFLYLNRFCFNGIYRTNQNGEFNVPFSGEGCGSMPDPDLFLRCSRRLRNVRFMHKDFESVLRCARPGDLVYMDPPYATQSRRVFREYHPDAFTYEDIKRLREWMERLNSSGIDFVVSYAESPEADVLKRGFFHELVAVRRNIAGFATHRKMSNELLITNIEEPA